MTSTSSWLLIKEGSDHVNVDEARLPYNSIRTLGRGSCSVVEEVEDRSTGRIYARKIFFMTGDRYQKKRRAEVFQNELGIIRSLGQHRHVIQLYATYISPKQCALILLPVANGGDLESFLGDLINYQSDPFQYGSKIQSMAQILQRAFGCLADGLSFMSERRVRHKDLKPQNILIHDGQVIYTDFGLSYDSSLFPSSETVGPTPSTPRYAAPEVSGGGTKDSSSDVFSLGCVFIEMLEALGVSFNYDRHQSYATAMDVIHKQLDSVQLPDRLVFLPNIIISMTSDAPTVRRTAKQISQIIVARPGFCCYQCRPTINTAITEVLQQIGFQGGGGDFITEPSQLPYRFIRELGSGNSSTVDEVEDTTSGRIYARKVFLIPRTQFRRAATQQRVVNLISTLQKLKENRHMIKLITTYKFEHAFFLILQPVATDGSLAQYLYTFRELRKLPRGDTQKSMDTMTQTLVRAFGCLAYGLEYIHSHMIRYNDVTPLNILVHDGKIIYTGFGFALDWSDLSGSTTSSTTGYAPRYSAPEIQNMEYRDSSSDVFSLGCVFLEILAALVDSSNFEEYTSIARNIKPLLLDLSRAQLPAHYQLFPPLIRLMTFDEPFMRSSAAEVASHFMLKPGFFCEECHSEHLHESIRLDLG
jgi:serine/threonine protein kinase